MPTTHWQEAPEPGWYVMPEVAQAVRVCAVGHIAAAALRASGGRVARLPAFPEAPYVLAGREIVWIGHNGPMHPRAVCVAGSFSLEDEFMPQIQAWRPVPASSCAGTAPRLIAAMSTLPGLLLSELPQRGYAPLIDARPLEFMLQARRDVALALASAASGNDPHRFIAAASRLLGLGAGLTPSGDDYVGGALFTLRLMRGTDPAWLDVAATIRALAPARTHAISAALLTDLANGESFAPLHDLMGAALADAPRQDLLARLRAVAAIGHSSGWDMLTGMFAATASLPENNHSST